MKNLMKVKSWLISLKLKINLVARAFAHDVMGEIACFLFDCSFPKRPTISTFWPYACYLLLGGKMTTVAPNTDPRSKYLTAFSAIAKMATGSIFWGR